MCRGEQLTNTGTVAASPRDQLAFGDNERRGSKNSDTPEHGEKNTTNLVAELDVSVFVSESALCR